MGERTAAGSGVDSFYSCSIDSYAGLKCTSILCRIIFHLCFYHYVVVEIVSHSIDKPYQ